MGSSDIGHEIGGTAILDRPNAIIQSEPKPIPHEDAPIKETQPQTNIEKFLSTLPNPTQEDKDLYGQWEQKRKDFLEKNDISIQENREGLKRIDQEVKEGRLGQAQERLQNEVIKALLPGIAQNMQRVLLNFPRPPDKLGSLDSLSLPEEYVQQRAHDLAKFVVFESPTEGELSPQQQILALHFIATASSNNNFLSNNYFLNYSEVLMEKSVNDALQKDPAAFDYTSRIDEVHNTAKKALFENSQRLFRALFTKYGFRPKVSPETLDFWERRINPDLCDYYDDLTYQIPSADTASPTPTQSTVNSQAA